MESNESPIYTDSNQHIVSEEDYINTQIELFLLLNKCRENPSLLISIIENTIPRFNGKIYNPKSNQENYITSEGVLVVYETINRLKNQEPLPPLKLSKGLFLASKTHCRDIGQNGLASHEGSNGLTLSQRIEIFGEWRGLIAENIAFNDYLAEDILINFILDDGNPNRGHRENLLNPELKCIGISCGPHSLHKSCCVMNLSTEVFESDIQNEEFDYMITQVKKYGESDIINREHIDDATEMEGTQNYGFEETSVS
jgi:hypothetical protein